MIDYSRVTRYRRIVHLLVNNCRGSNRLINTGGSSSGSKLYEYVAKAPTQEASSPWKRLAEQIKDGGDSIYLARLSQSYDKRDHIEKIEDEIREEMAQALGRAGSKCDYMFLLLERLGKQYDEATDVLTKRELAVKFNSQRDIAMKAREDLAIHRQAAGLRVKNQHIVEEFWPLPNPKPTK